MAIVKFVLRPVSPLVRGRQFGLLHIFFVDLARLSQIRAMSSNSLPKHYKTTLPSALDYGSFFSQGAIWDPKGRYAAIY